MAAVIEFRPQARVAGGPSLRSIRRGSRGLELLFTGLLIGLLVITLASQCVILFYQGDHAVLGRNGGLISARPITDVAPFRSWALDQKLIYCGVAVVRSAPSVCLFWFLRALFRLYSQGIVFSERNTAAIKAMGVCLVADAAAPFACHLGLSLTGREIDKLWMHMSSVQELVLGGVVFVIAMVMHAGREIEEDRAGFV